MAPCEAAGQSGGDGGQNNNHGAKAHDAGQQMSQEHDQAVETHEAFGTRPKTFRHGRLIAAPPHRQGETLHNNEDDRCFHHGLEPLGPLTKGGAARKQHPCADQEKGPGRKAEGLAYEGKVYS